MTWNSRPARRLLPKLSIIVIAALALIGLSGMAIAALGPILGVGSAEEFLFFELLGMRRRQFFANDGTLFLLAFVAFITHVSFFLLNMGNSWILTSWAGLGRQCRLPVWVKSRRRRGKIRYLSERVNHVSLVGFPPAPPTAALSQKQTREFK